MNSETYYQFLRFKEKQFLTKDELLLAEEYVYGYLYFDYDNLEMYAYSNCLTKCQIVLHFKKENNLKLKTRLGEVICENKASKFH